MISNAQRTVNTTVQPSQLNGGHLAKSFDLQSMRTVGGSVKLQPNLQENTSEFIIYQGNADITGSNSFILYDSLIVYVQSIFQISYINSTITTTLPLINTSPPEYIGPTDCIYIGGFDKDYASLVSNYDNNPNYIILYDYPGNTVGGSPYTPGDVLTIEFLDENVTYSLSSSSVVYYTVTVLFGNTGMDNLYVGVIAYDSSTDTFDYNYPTNLGYSYTFNNVSYLGLRVISYTQVLDSTGNPLTLGPNDFVIGYSVANSSTNPITPASINTTVGEGNSPLLQFSINTEKPQLELNSRIWRPNSNGNTYPITPQLCTGLLNGSLYSLNSGFGSFGFNTTLFLSSTCSQYCWVQIDQYNNPFTITTPAQNAGVVNIRLMIISFT